MANPNPNEITRFKPGQSGNPGGKPKGRSLTSILREALDEEADFSGNPLPGGKRVADVFIRALLMHALDGDASLIKEVLARIDGKIAEKPDDPPDPVPISDQLSAALREAYGDKSSPPDEVPGGNP